VIEGNFHGLEHAEPVRSSGDHTDFVVEALSGARGNLAFRLKPVQDHRLVSAEHAGHLLHRFQTAPHCPVAPVVEESTGPDRGSIMPKVAKVSLSNPMPVQWPACWGAEHPAFTKRVRAPDCYGAAETTACA
jgi:hypothetical protein